MLDKPLCDYLGHKLVSIVDALTALIAEREGIPAARSDGSAGASLSASGMAD
jgi:hypothetical protein